MSETKDDISALVAGVLRRITAAERKAQTATDVMGKLTAKIETLAESLNIPVGGSAETMLERSIDQLKERIESPASNLPETPDSSAGAPSPATASQPAAAESGKEYTLWNVSENRAATLADVWDEIEAMSTGDGPEDFRDGFTLVASREHLRKFKMALAANWGDYLAKKFVAAPPSPGPAEAGEDSRVSPNGGEA
jgi:hypothetical protein